MAGQAWWQTGIVYQIYPRSFADSTGDGVGDLRGIETHLDYLVTLGIDAIWLSPFYPSPMADFGYDISNYCDVDALFGTLADFDRLIAAVHARGIKLIVDYVPNHTSNQHPWFAASRTSRDDAKRAWYVWRDPAPDGGPPNNWLARFGGSAWTFDQPTGQYYLHSFLPQQPDLNWRNPDVRDAMYDVLRFWLDRGVDGFRVDVLWLLVKDDLFRDDPPNLTTYSADRPEVHEIVREMRAVLDSYGERILIGEIYLPVTQLVTYYGKDLDGVQMPFNFQLMLAAWNAESIAEIVRSYEAALPPGAWPNYVLGNHDNHRVATRIGSAQARVAAVLLLTLRGTPTMYYGDELGMRDTLVPPDRIRDPAELRQPGIGEGRDPERTPMLWNRAAGHGFTMGTPWLPFGDDGRANVEDESTDADSMLALYRTLIALRRSHAVLVHGDIANVSAAANVMSFERVDASTRLRVMLNFGNDPQTLPIEPSEILVRTAVPPAASLTANIVIEPNEAVVLRVQRA